MDYFTSQKSCTCDSVGSANVCVLIATLKQTNLEGFERERPIDKINQRI